MEKREVITKIGKVVASVLLYAFILICIIGLALSIAADKEGDGTATIFGYQMRYVLSSSMEKCEDTDVSMYDIKDIPMRSMVFIEVVPEDEEEAKEWYADIEVGDVLTIKYVYVKQEVITHRVTGIRAESDGAFTIRLDGDNKASDSETLTQIIDTGEKNTPNYIVGKVVGTNYVLGLLVSLLRSQAGLIFAVILPCALIALWEIFRLITLLNADKRAHEKAAHDSEVEELKRRLAELESAAKKNAPENGEAPENAEAPENSGDTVEEADSNTSGE